VERRGVFLGIFPRSPHMEGTNRLHIKFADITSWTDHGKEVRGSLPKMGQIGPDGDAAAPPVTLNRPIFGWSTPLVLLSGSMWVLEKDEAICFGFSLILLSFGPYLAWLWASLLWAS